MEQTILTKPLKIPFNIHRELKIYCASSGEKIQETAARFIAEGLKREQKTAQDGKEA